MTELLAWMFLSLMYFESLNFSDISFFIAEVFSSFIMVGCLLVGNEVKIFSVQENSSISMKCHDCQNTTNKSS